VEEKDEDTSEYWMLWWSKWEDEAACTVVVPYTELRNVRCLSVRSLLRSTAGGRAKSGGVARQSTGLVFFVSHDNRIRCIVISGSDACKGWVGFAPSGCGLWRGYRLASRRSPVLARVHIVVHIRSLVRIL